MPRGESYGVPGSIEAGRTGGKAITDPAALPEPLQDFSREAKQAAMDAYNGAIASEEPESTAIAAAIAAAKQVDGGEVAGQSDQLASSPTRRQPRVPPGGGGPGGPGAGGAGLGNALRQGLMG